MALPSNVIDREYQKFVDENNEVAIRHSAYHRAWDAVGEAWEKVQINPTTGGMKIDLATTADQISITDAGGYYTGTEVETALAEIGAGTTLDARYVNVTGDETIAGIKTFSSTIVGSITGNAATVTTNANLTGHITSTGNATLLGSFSSSNLLTALTDETGTGVAVFGTTPTFTTSIISPKIIGGTSTTQTLTYQTTSGVGATGARHIFLVGNNGATEAMTILNSGNVGIGTTGPVQKLEVNGNIFSNGGTSAYGSALMGQVSNYPGIWFGSNTATPSTVNYAFLYSDVYKLTAFNTITGGSILFRIANSADGLVLDKNKNVIVGGQYDTLANQKLDVLGGAYISGNVGIGITAPLAKCHIDQATSDAAIPVLSLDQADISDGFINFIGTSAASAAGPISSWTAGNTIQGFVRVEINDAQYWQPYYNAPTS